MFMHCTLDILVTGEWKDTVGVDTDGCGDGYVQETSADFLFYSLEKTTNWTKKLTKIEEKLSESVKHCLK